MSSKPHRVVVLAVPPVVPFDLSIPAQVLSGVELATGRAAYDLRLVTPDGRPGATTVGYGVTPQGGLELIAEADTVVVAGSHAPGLHERGEVATEVVDALRGAAARRVRMVSLCTGSFVLAATGMLDGRRAATHWLYADRFMRLFPRVQLDVEALYVDGGALLSSAGGAAAIDLCLHLVREDHGSAVANQVARLTVVSGIRAGAEAQLVDRPVARTARTSTAIARSRMLGALDRSPGLDELAASAGMSTRTFTRRFRQETGLSVLQWLARARLDHARHLLEATDLAVEQVAARSGFGTGERLRKAMTSALGVTPSAYRRDREDVMSDQPAGSE